MTLAESFILIVEDNDKNRKLARDVLEFHGFRIAEAEDAATGVRLARELKPDLVLMDIQLPDMDGRAALAVLRDDASTASIPVVALTAFAMKGDRESFLSAGFDGYISKPIDVRDFPAQVRGFCKGG